MYGMEKKVMKLTNKRIHTDSHGRTSLITVPPRELYLGKNTHTLGITERIFLATENW
jgi:hypothetical protein